MATSSSLPRLQPITDDDSAAVLISPVEATPVAPARSQPVPPSTGASGTRHRRSASDIKPTSPAARRMSMSKTPQVGRGTLEGGIQVGLRRIGGGIGRVGKRPVLGMAALLSLIVLLCTAYSSSHAIALDTSLHPSPVLTSYFAQKSNALNQYFVKLAWLHTSLIYLPHLFISPSTPLVPHLVPYALSTSFWAVFTTWFFGRGLGDRIIELSGGECVITLPAQWGLNREVVEEMMKIVPSSVGATLLASTLDSTSSSLAETANMTPEETMYLAVPPSLCTSRLPLTPKSHPDIFAILSALPFPQSVYSESERPTLQIPKPRWYRGHDISGHVFILVLSTLLLTRRLVPTWRRWLGGSSARVGAKITYEPKGNEQWRRRIHAGLTVAGTALVLLWVWMTAMTAVYFHNPQEKMSGLALGLFTAFLVDLFTPSSARITSAARAPGPTGSQIKLPPALDENGARRGEVDVRRESTALGVDMGMEGKEKAV